MDYTDFTIRARDWEDGQFKVEVTDSPMDRMREADRVTYPSDVGRRLRTLERKNITTSDLKSLGEDLADLLLPPTVRRMLLSSQAAIGPDRGLRLRLVLDDLRVANLPWEYMYVKRPGLDRGQDGFLALDPQISMVRHEPIPMAPGSVSAQLPLKLVVGFSSPEGVPKLDLEAEKAFIHGALDGVDNVQLEFVDRLTVPALEAACQGAHLFHFAGHGAFFWEDGNEAYGNGVIFLEDSQGKKLPYPVEKLALTLRGAGVRVVVLGGCETGRRDGVNAWSGVAPALMRVGVPAVVAMQYSVYDDAAVAFARRFYQALSVGLSLDEAMLAGRLAILNQGPNDDVDWGVPVLYMRSADGVVFPEVTADSTLENYRTQERVTVWQRNQDLHEVMTGIESEAVPGDGVVINQVIDTITRGGQAIGARIDQFANGRLQSNQKVKIVGQDGKITGVRIHKMN